MGDGKLRASLQSLPSYFYTTNGKERERDVLTLEGGRSQWRSYIWNTYTKPSKTGRSRTDEGAHSHPHSTQKKTKLLIPLVGYELFSLNICRTVPPHGVKPSLSWDGPASAPSSSPKPVSIPASVDSEHAAGSKLVSGPWHRASASNNTVKHSGLIAPPSSPVLCSKKHSKRHNYLNEYNCTGVFPLF